MQNVNTDYKYYRKFTNNVYRRNNISNKQDRNNTKDRITKKM